MFDLKSLLEKNCWKMVLYNITSNCDGAIPCDYENVLHIWTLTPPPPPSLHVLCTLTHFLFAPSGFRRHRRLQDEKAKYVAFLLGNGKQMTGGATGLFI